MSKESEYKELFLAEALENFEDLNKLFTELEKDHGNKKAINSIFRITHTLKGNAMGMGFDDIAGLSHIMEDIFGAVINGSISFTNELFDSLFRANDKLGDLIQSLESGKKVSYLGIKTKLSVFLKNAKNDAGDEDAVDTSDDTSTTEVSEEPELVPETLPDSDKDIDSDEQEIKFAEVIQIPVKKMDEMMNLVGQLIIEKDRLLATSSSNGRKSSDLEGLQRITSNLQYSVMKARMVQMGFLFNKFHRIVRDVASQENKRVNLILKGTDIEIDRNILKIMSDSLIHLVRNAVSHGIESGDFRLKSKKPEAGTVTLNALSEKDNVVIEVMDDGNGIDVEKMRTKIVEKGLVNYKRSQQLSEGEVISYIFEPGFSNAAKVTAISGRGVGMDVVKKAAESIGGQVRVNTELGKGTKIILSLPSSMALKGALIFELEGQEYAIALSYTEAVVSFELDDIHKIGGGLMAKYLDQTISIIFLKDLIQMEDLLEVENEGVFHRTFDELENETHLNAIIVSYADKLIGLVVDKLLLQKEIIEKTLSKPLEKTKLLSGTTILGNGKVCPVIDVPAVTDILFKSGTTKTSN